MKELEFETCMYSKRLLSKLAKLNNVVEHPLNLNIVNQAICYAKKYHGSQKRLTGEAYYSHPIEVAYMLAEYTAKNEPQYFRLDLIITAILHDTIEDTDLTKEMIAIEFGDQLAFQVEKLTRVKKDRKISSAEIIESLWQHKRYDIILIKLFDRIHNIQTIGVKPPEKIRETIEETVKSFVTISVYYEARQLETILTNLCYKHLLNPTLS